jgi:uncharacterized repeat protein (TIGR01451 family)
MGKVGTLKRLLVASAATTVVLVAAAVSGAAPGTDASVTTFDQCANGGPPSTSTGCPENWINGILNAQNSHYAEDDVTPQRVILELPKNSPTTGRTVEISYLTRKGGVHAYDSLATWNYTQSSAVRCANLAAADCVPGGASLLAVPPDPTVVADNNGSGSATSGHQLSGQNFTLYGGTLTSASAYTHDDPGGSSDEYAHITLEYSVPSTADGAKVMLLFGGHIAAGLGPRGWGAGVGAGSISGGPYHVRITAADGASVGNRDNQITSGAILSPANIVIKKNTVGGDGTFSYTATGGISSSFDISTSGGTGSQSFTDISPGSYTVTESGPPAGWDFTNLACVDEDGGSTVDLNARKANIDLDPGETVICTYTNTKRGNIIIEKQTLPDGSPQLFTFTRSYGANVQLSDGQQNDSGFLAPGNYSVGETVPNGWTQTSATCDDGSSPSSISLHAGETVKCTFNNAQNGQVIVKKVMVGGTDSFDYSGTPSGAISANNGTISQAVSPGQYTSTEAAKAGWDLSSISCSDGNSSGSVANRQATFNVEAGETVTCTFTNTKQGQVIVKKVMVGGTDSFDYSGTPAGTISSNNGTISANVAAGQYTSTEAAKAGWNLTSVVCDDTNSAGSVQNRQATFNVEAGETVTCTFTNTRQGQVIVKKVMVGGTDTFNYTGSPAGSISVNNGTISANVAPGAYSSVEDAKAGWSLTSISCDDGNSSGSVGTRTANFNVEAGETVTCTFTNTKQGQVIVKKVMVGGTDTFSYSGTPSGAISVNNGTISQNVGPGQYVSTEADKSGWNLTGVVCDDANSAGSVANRQATFNVEAGETVTCTFTNTKQGQVIVKKVMVGGTDSFAYSGTPGGSIAVNNGTITADVAPGQYVSTEAAKAGWDLTSVACDDGDSVGSVANRQATFNVAAGETVTCTFTNTKRGTIIVEKQTSPNGAAGSFAFSGDAAGSIGDNGQIVVSNLVPGTYTSTEAETQGWSLSSIVCSDANSTGSLGSRSATFKVEAGETVKCTFTNAKLGQGSISVSKSADPTSVKEPGGPVTYSVTITNTSADVDVHITSVVDDKFGDLDDDGGSGCFDVPINLKPGEKVSCQFTKTITGVGGTSHINTVTASGTDDNGNPVSASDDAKVDITPRLIDLVIVKDATSPTPLNGIVDYSLTVTNKGPDTATNVQLADPAPAGITYLTANPSQGTCNVGPSLITCSLGSIAAGQTVTIAITARATTVGSHTNTATVTGGGGRETNPADNVDTAVTVVPAPLKPPTVKPTPAPEYCLALTVSPKMIKADGKPDKVTIKVTAGAKPVNGVKVGLSGAGVKKSAKTNGKGVAVLRINPKKPGLITVTVVESNHDLCGPKRIGVVGVFLPPLTG